MEDHPADRDARAPREEAGLESTARVEAMRALVARHLRGERRLSEEVQRLAVDLARAARREGVAPERLLITIRSLWRELGLSQADRLQAASLYEQLVRDAIERYYGEPG